MAQIVCVAPPAAGRRRRFANRPLKRAQRAHIVLWADPPSALPPPPGHHGIGENVSPSQDAFLVPASAQKFVFRLAIIIAQHVGDGAKPLSRHAVKAFRPLLMYQSYLLPRDMICDTLCQ
jgi:hypothetical protein